MIELVEHSPTHFDWDSEWAIDVRSGMVVRLPVDYSPDKSVGDKPVMVLDGRFIEQDHRLD